MGRNNARSGRIPGHALGPIQALQVCHCDLEYGVLPPWRFGTLRHEALRCEKKGSGERQKMFFLWAVVVISGPRLAPARDVREQASSPPSGWWKPAVTGGDSSITALTLDSSRPTPINHSPPSCQFQVADGWLFSPALENRRALLRS